MTIVRKIFERGIELVRRPLDWELSTGEEITVSLRINYSTKIPIAIEERYGSDQTVSLLLPDGSRYGLQITELMQYHIENFLAWKEVDYLLKAIGYHCMNLAENYAFVRRSYVVLSRIPGFGDHEQGTYNSAGIYFELDALLTAARRALDICRYFVWKRFGNEGSLPSNFIKTIRAARRLPAGPKQEIENLWTSHFDRLTAYRDCIVHNTSLTDQLPCVFMDRRELGV